MAMHESSELAVTTFVASTYASEACGSNGLPLTPNSIRILGRFQVLKTFKHKYLCQYVDIVRGKHERLYVVSEHYHRNLQDLLNEETQLGLQKIMEVIFKLLQALSYLNECGIVHRCLCPETILLTNQDDVKLCRYGFYHMTYYGHSVAFPICQPKYMSPEVLSLFLHSTSHISDLYSEGGIKIRPSGPKVDVWAIGIILIQLYLGKSMWKNCSIKQLFFKVISMSKTENVAKFIFEDIGEAEKLKEMEEDLYDFITMCLTVDPCKRPTAVQLIKHRVFNNYKLKVDSDITVFKDSFPSVKLRCRDLAVPEPITYDVQKIDHLRQRSIFEIYYLWKLVGGDVEAEFRRQGYIKTLPPICTLPSLVVDECKSFGEKRDSSFLLDHKTIILSLSQLKQRLENVAAQHYYPLIQNCSTSLTKTQSSTEVDALSKLPLVIREKDVEYQLHRLILLSRLLDGYPYKRAHICKEARIDIPPLYRPHIWAALLDVNGDIQATYDNIDKETPTTTDRQIEVDIPRCHQYDELLSSPTGHIKFKRLLKAWVVSHPQYVYWQGLDSLCAPFLYLNFNDEAVAYACLTSFIPKYLHKFFLKDNSAIIQEYLAVFAHLITFHDPELTNHLDAIGFIPELYAIPWFLTMYTHVFPLSKIFHLWDTLLLGNPSFPLCIGVAILNQLRANLLSFGFNECILLFSDMPQIDIEKCVNDSIKFFCSMPKSISYRQHENNSLKTNCSKGIPTLSSQQNGDEAEVEALQLHLSMDPLPLEVLKAEMCSRISAQDLLDLLGLIPGTTSQQPKIKLIVVDVRASDEYRRGAVPRSINIPFQTAFAADGSLNPKPQVNELVANKGRLVVVVGNRGTNASNFAAKLVQLCYPKVCILHKGIDVLKPVGILVVPAAS